MDSLGDAAPVQRTAADRGENDPCPNAAPDHVLALTPFMIARCSRELRYRSVTPAYAAMLGRRVDELTGRRLADVLGSEAMRTIGPHVERVLRGEAVRYEATVDLDGVGARTLLVTYQPERDAGGAVSGWVASLVDVTAQRYAEDAVRESERRFRTMADSSPLMIWVTDATGRIEFVNRAYLEFFAIALDRVRGDGGWQALVHPDDRGYVEAYLASLRERTAFRAEARVRHADGSWRWIASFAEPRFSAEGEFLGHVGASPDITDRKRLEEELQASRNHLQRIVDELPIAVGVLDTSGTWTLTNALMDEYVPEMIPSASRSRAAQWHAWDDDGRPIPPEDWPGRRALRGEAVVPGQEMLRSFDDGREAWMRVSTAPLHDTDGSVAGAVCVVADIDAVKRAEQKLRHSEALFRTLGEASPMIISLADGNGRLKYVSPAWTEYSGQSAEAFISGQWREAIHPDDRERIRAIWKRAVVERRGVEYEFRARAADGEFRWMLTYGRPTVDSGGALAWVNCSLDIDDRKRVEERLRETDRRKDEFIATLAHELRNPLAPVRTGLDVLPLLPPDAPERSRVMAMMDRQVTHMTRLVEDLLEVSRITRGKIELRKDRVDLALVVRHCAEAAGAALAARGQTLALDLPEGPLPVAADPVRLSQVVTNLLSNAGKYSDESGAVRLSLTAEDGTAVLRVRDEGVGIPRDMLGRVFEPFTQVARSVGRAQGGLGIGLTLVKQIVEMHGGTVTAESEGEGRGALFTVRLPLAAGQAARDARPQPPRNAVRSEGALRVLVVDDNEDATTSLSLILRLDGNEVRTAQDGFEAEREAEAFRPQVVLLDIGMPGRNGYDVARRFRAQEWGRSMLLVALTGWGQEQDRARSREAGFDVHLVKPVDYAEVTKVLASFRRALVS